MEQIDIDLKNIKRILLVNPFGIGDVLFATPLIKNLRKFYPSNYIAFLCNKRSSCILENNPYIDEVFVFEKDDWRALWRKSKIRFLRDFFSFMGRLKKRGFDLCIDLSLNSRFGFFLKRLNIPYRIGYDFKGRARFLTHRIPLEGYSSKHIVEYYLDLLRYLRIPAGDNSLDFFIDNKDRQWADDFTKINFKEKKKRIVLVPAGGASWGKDSYVKHWPPEKFAGLIDRILKELNAYVIISGSPEERRIANRIVYLMEKGGVFNLAGKLTLGQFAALLKNTDVLISNDGGPLHIGVALDVATISIFGPVDESVYGPYPSSRKHVVIRKSLPCRPCYKKFRLPACPHERECINSIEIEDVFEGLKDLLGYSN